MRAIILCLFLAACASPAPTTYSQGAYRPAPPAFNPVTDAPITIGQPGYVRPGVQAEPGPKPTRVLPETPQTRREPGIWASDTGAPSGEEWQRVLNIYLPMPESITSAAEAWPVARCARHINTRLDALGLMERARALSTRSIRACLAARLYQFCAQFEADDLARKRAAGEMLVLNVERVMNAILAEATAFRARACGRQEPREVADIAAAVEKRWATVETP